MNFGLIAAIAVPPDGRAAMDIAVSRGCRAELVLLQARDPIEAIRLRATRLAVICSGRLVAPAEPRPSRLFVPDRPEAVDPAAYASHPAGPMESTPC